MEFGILQQLFNVIITGLEPTTSSLFAANKNYFVVSAVFAPFLSLSTTTPTVYGSATTPSFFAVGYYIGWRQRIQQRLQPPPSVQ
jgi:hypothetical protein